MPSTHLDGSSSLNIIRQRAIESEAKVVQDPITERRASLPGSGIHVLHGAPPSSLNPSDSEQAPSPPPPIGGKASKIAVQEAKTVADHALGLKQGNKPASGLNNKDLAMMRELGTIGAMVEDRGRSGGGKPISKSAKTRLQQRVTTLDQHLAGVIRRDDNMSELRSAFNRDFAQLSKSPSVKTLRDSRAELRKVESELNQLTDFDKFHISTKVAIQRTPNITKGQEASNEIEKILGDDLVTGGDREARKIRKKKTAASLNASKLQKLMPNNSQRRERVKQLGIRCDQLLRTIDKTQSAVLHEAQPMIKKYGQHGFDADPGFWERGGRGLTFPALQTHTKQAIHYARTTLIPDLEEAM